jgi:hypothetical protein
LNELDGVEIRLLDDCAKIALPFLLDKNHRKNGAKDWPDIFADIADTSYKIALEMLKKRGEIINGLNNQDGGKK